MSNDGAKVRTVSLTNPDALAVINGFRNQNNPWLTSNEIAEKFLPEARRQARYNLVSRMADPSNGMLLRRTNPELAKADYQYQLAEKYLTMNLDKIAPKVGADKRGYIRWTAAEREIIVKRAYLIRKFGAVGGVKDALDQAQRVLIKEGTLHAARYRKVTNTTEIADIRTEMERLSAIGYKGDTDTTVTAASAPVLHPLPPPVETPVLPTPTPEAVQKPVEASAPHHAPKAPRAADISTGALLESLLGRIEHSATKILANAVEYGITRAFRSIMATEKGEKLFEALTQGKADEPLPQRHQPIAPQTDQKEARKRVLIAGIRSPEVTEVVDEFGEVFDLRFWKEGSRPRLLKDMAKYVDTTVLMVSRMGHSDTELITDAKLPSVKVQGAVGPLRDALMNLLVQ